MEEALRIAHQMWTGPVGPYQGTHYQLTQTLNSPAAVSQPHPPILIGGSGEKKTLRLVAQYADACNLFTYGGIDLLRTKLDVLRRHCDVVARPYEAIEKTTLGTVHLAPGAMTPAQVIAQCQELASVGIQHAIVNMPNVHEITPLEVFGREIIPAVAGL